MSGSAPKPPRYRFIHQGFRKFSEDDEKARIAYEKSLQRLRDAWNGVDLPDDGPPFGGHQITWFAFDELDGGES